MAKDLTKKRYLTTGEVARAMGMSEDTIKRWCQDGRLPAERPGGSGTRWRIVVAALRERNPGVWEDLEEARGEKDVS